MKTNPTSRRGIARMTPTTSTGSPDRDTSNESQASIELLARARLCRVACAHENQPYVTPMHCAYDDNHLYGFSTLGQKITWLRANPLVCVLVDEIVSPQDWASVIVFGKYEELDRK